MSFGTKCSWRGGRSERSLVSWASASHGAQVRGPVSPGSAFGGQPRPRPVWDAVATRVQALLAESGQCTGHPFLRQLVRLTELCNDFSSAISVAARAAIFRRRAGLSCFRIRSRFLASAFAANDREVGVEPSVGFRDELPVEPLLAASGLVTATEHDASSLRVECEGEAPDAICGVEAQFLHVHVA
jgi:hypothetical protein